MLVIVEDKADVAAFANYTPDAAAAPSAAAPAAPAAAAAPAVAPAAAAAAAPAAAPVVARAAGARVFASPLARAMAREKVHLKFINLVSMIHKLGFTLIMHKIGFKSNHHTFPSMLLTKIVLRSEFS